MGRLLPAGMVFILLTIRCHQQPLVPKRIVERISHRLGQPALLCRDASPTLLACSAAFGQPPIPWGQTGWAEMTKRTLISVVEDDQPFRESMRKLMTALGYTVEAFSSAADFLASPILPATGCLVTDVQMPGMSGVELHRHLVDSGHVIPTILVTAYPDDITRNRALKDGVVCYLSKPVDDEHLERCLRSALESGKPHEQHS